jgi:hypothetical protein
MTSCNLCKKATRSTRRIDPDRLEARPTAYVRSEQLTPGTRCPLYTSKQVRNWTVHEHQGV